MPAMDRPDGDLDRTLRRQEASEAVGGLGWRLVLGQLRTTLPAGSLAEAADLAGRVTAACGSEADGRLWIDLRRDQLVLSLQSSARAAVTPREVALARRISEVASGLGLATGAGVGDGGPRSVQVVEVAIDAMDIAAVRPFWKAVLGYADEPGRSGPEDPLVDPVGQAPAVWFQQMDAPRPQRNRIHIDIDVWVPYDQAAARIPAALAAGGRLVTDEHAPEWWVLADVEGNEVDVCTTMGRD
jgi:4a-hydroxytetrahydrobiopterin dehydratase